MRSTDLHINKAHMREGEETDSGLFETLTKRNVKHLTGITYNSDAELQSGTNQVT